MPIIKRDKVVPHASHLMFNLVNKIEDYPDFVPWCKSTHIISRDTDEIRARLDFARGGLSKSFTTCNRLQENKIIEIRLLDGPFQQLEGFWRFEPVNDDLHCHISLDLEFEFANKIMGAMFAPMFNPIANTLVDVFCQRADQIYGAE